MIRPLTSLRFIFAFLVFVSHLSFLDNSPNSSLQWAYQSFLKEGSIGVSFFFILSGFILAYNYQSRVLEGYPIKHFLVARFARIYPLHLLTFLISVPLTLDAFFDEPILWSLNGMVNLTLIQSFFSDKAIYFAFNAPAWSISAEMFFYLSFPALIFLFNKLRRDVALLIFVGLVVVILWSMVVVASHHHHHIFYVNPAVRLFDFVLGILIFNLFSHLKNSNIKLSGSGLEVASLLVLILFFFAHPFIPNVLRYSVYYWIPVSFVILVFASSRGIISSMLSTRPLVLLGKLSFGFYMFHLLVLRYLGILNSKYFLIDDHLVIIGLSLLVTLFLSYITFIGFEQKANLFLRSNLIKERTLAG